MPGRLLGLVLVLAVPVLAQVGAPRQPVPPASQPDKTPHLRVFILHDADALDVVRLVRQLYGADEGKKFRLTVHQRSNSITVLAPTEELETIEDVVLRIEKLSGEAKKAKGDRPPDSTPLQPTPLQPKRPQ